jgi:hypothetical protein
MDQLILVAAPLMQCLALHNAAPVQRLAYSHAPAFMIWCAAPADGAIGTPHLLHHRTRELVGHAAAALSALLHLYERCDRNIQGQQLSAGDATMWAGHGVCCWSVVAWARFTTP